MHRTFMVTCPNCQHQNPDGSRFCNNCGQPLPLICPNCGHQNPSGARFCNWCGHNLVVGEATPPSFSQEGSTAGPTAVPPTSTPQQLVESLETARQSVGPLAERRIVTILFCDITGSTAAAAKLDPEDWTEVINGAFEQMIRPVYDFGGTVPRLMGDGLLAFFGAPQAHEDDPERAVLAGLEIIRRVQIYAERIRPRWDIDLNVRVGINSGLVTVGEVGSGQRVEYTAMGDAINLAARMEQSAAPGTVQIAQATYTHVAGLFEFEPLGQIQVKGKEEDQAAYRVLGKITQSDRLPAPAKSPFIGREAEVKILQNLLDNLQNGLGQVACLIGDAGLGKSRLIEEVCLNWRADQGSLNEDSHYPWFECYGISYEMDRPYGLFQRLVRDLLQSSEDAIDTAFELGMEIAIDTPMDIDMVREKIEGVENQPGSALALLLGLESNDSGSALEGEALKAALFEAVEKLLEGWGSSRPAILLLDDLQWADQASIELICHLFHLVDRSPILLLCLFRPDRQAPSWNIKLTAETNFNHLYTELTLNPLDNAQSLELVEALLAGVPVLAKLPGDLSQTIIAKSEGNPFFIEEVFRGLIEMEVTDNINDSRTWHLDGESEEIIRIPNSVQALLTARIDRLEERSKHTLQIASVIGRRFIYKILQEIHTGMERLDEQINTLERAAFIREVIRLPEREYQFNQALVQEAAYHTLLRRERRYFHRRVAESIEGLFPDRIEEFATQLAYHYDQAGDARAAFYHRLSGDIAFRLHANIEAITHYDRALTVVKEIATADDKDLTYLYDRRGRAMELAGRYEEALANYEQMEEMAQTSQNRQMALDALVRQGLIRSFVNAQFDPKKAIDLSNRALQLAQELGDQEAEARTLWNLLNIGRFGFLDLGQAIQQGERSLAIARQLGLEDLQAYILNDLGDTLLVAGQVEKSKPLLDEALTLWRRIGNHPMLADNLTNNGYWFFNTGDYEKALDHYEEAYQISIKVHSLWGQAYSRIFLGQVYRDIGRPGEAIHACDMGIKLSEQAEFLVGEISPKAMMGMIYGELGAVDYGLVLAKEATAKSKTLAELLYPHCAGYQSRLHLMNGDIDSAAALLDPLQRTNPFWEVSFKSVIEIAKSVLELARGAPEKALIIAGNAVTDLDKMGARAFLPDAVEQMARALIMLGREEEAVAELESVRSLAEEINHRWSLWSILILLSTLLPDQEKALKAQASKIVLAIADETPEHDPDSGLNLQESFLARPAVRRLLEESVN